MDKRSIGAGTARVYHYAGVAELEDAKVKLAERAAGQKTMPEDSIHRFVWVRIPPPTQHLRKSQQLQGWIGGQEPKPKRQQHLTSVANRLSVQ